MGELKAQLRALKIFLETRLQSPVEACWAIVELTIPLASDLINGYLVGSDGKTAHYRIYMHNFNGMAFECGEQVMAKPVREGNWKKIDRNPKRKFSVKSNWIEGTWGRARQQNSRAHSRGAAWRASAENSHSSSPACLREMEPEGHPGHRGHA